MPARGLANPALTIMALASRSPSAWLSSGPTRHRRTGSALVNPDHRWVGEAA